MAWPQDADAVTFWKEGVVTVPIQDELDEMEKSDAVKEAGVRLITVDKRKNFR